LKMTKDKKEFLDWTVECDRNQHINASDAKLEELYGTPKRKYYPSVDWDINGQYLKKD